MFGIFGATTKIIFILAVYISSLILFGDIINTQPFVVQAIFVIIAGLMLNQYIFKSASKAFGIILIILVMDLLTPPLLIGLDGNFASSGGLLLEGSSDYIVYVLSDLINIPKQYIISPFNYPFLDQIGIPIPTRFIFAYFVVPLLIFFGIKKTLMNNSL